MNKLISSVILVLLMSLGLPRYGIAEEIKIVGTGSGAVLLREMARSFNRENPGMKISVPESIGSGGGIKAVGNDNYVLGRVARPIKDREEHFGLTYVPIAKIPIVFFTHPDVGVTDLEPGEVNGIYSGEIFNWQEVGGINARIRVIRREEGDSSLVILKQSFPGFKDIAITPYSKTTHSDPSTFGLVESTPHTIAFGAYTDALRRDVRPVAISGIKPTAKKYPCTGTLALIFKQKNYAGIIEKIIDFVQSAKGEKIIVAAGGLPVR